MNLDFFRSFLYFPEPLPPDAPLPAQAEGAEEAFLPTADGETAHALWWPPPADDRPVLLYFHGNAGNVHDWAIVRGELSACEAGLLLPDYHGYGKSSGRPTEKGLYADADAALAFLRERGVPAARVVLLGKSLGGGVATELARRMSRAGAPPRGVILESTFTSIAAVGNRLFPWLPVGGLVPDHFDSAAKLAEVDAPVFVVHGARDDLVPVTEAQALFERARPPKRLWLVPEADHNDVCWVAGAEYGRRLRAFLDDPAVLPDRRES